MLSCRLVFVTALLSIGTILPADAPWPPPVDFTHPQMPYVNMDPGADYADTERMFQGIPSIAVAPGGRLWATWYAGGTGEAQANYVVLATSGDDGRTWSAPKIVVDPPFRASEPAVWTDPGGRLWFIFNLYPVRSSVEDRREMQQRVGSTASYDAFIHQYNFVGTQMWAMTTGNPDAEAPGWDAPRLIAMESHNMNKPTVLSDGTWVWPAAPVTSARGLLPRPLYSTDAGRTFTYRGPVPVPAPLANAHEYQVVERRDGSLWLLNRVGSGIGESFSTDGGHTWTEMRPAEITHTVSRFFITRLLSGRLLLVKHGPVDADVGRSRLMAFLSDDDGATWTGGLMVDERPGTSYPDGQQTPDGIIRIIYDYNRHHDKEILMAAFTEEDVAAGKAVSPHAAFRVVVNKALARNTVHDRGPELRANDDGVPFRREPAGAWAVEGYESEALLGGARLFSDREYYARETPAQRARAQADALLQTPGPATVALEGAMFLRTPIEGQKRLRVARAGRVHVLTPLPDRNDDSLSASLEAQGFQKVALTEIQLFGGGPGERTSLYQKECTEGETIMLGKWGVPLYFE